MNNKCQIANHSSRSIITVCFAPQCKNMRVSCQICQTEFHKDHIDQLVDFSLLMNFINNQSLKQNEDSIKLIDAQKQLNLAQKDFEELKNLFAEQLKALSSNNLQQFCNILQNSGDYQQMGNQKLNQLAQDLLPYVQSINGELIEKEKPENQLSNSYFQFLNIFSQTMTQMVNEFKDINKKVVPNSFLKFSVPFKLQGHTNVITSIDICEQKNLLVSGSFDKTIRIWNLLNTTLLKTYQNTKFVYEVVFSYQGNLIAFSESSMVIKLIEIDDKQEQINQLLGHKNVVLKLNFSRDGQYLISGSCDSTVKIWNVQTRVELFKLNLGSEVYGALISRDNKLVAASSDNGEIKIWDFSTSKLLCTQQAHQSKTGIQFSNDLLMLVSSGKDSIKLWSLNQSKLSLIKEFKGSNYNIVTALLTADSNFIITYCSDNQNKKVNVIDYNSGQKIKCFDGKNQHNQVECARYLAITQRMDVFTYIDGDEIVVWKYQLQN